MLVKAAEVVEVRVVVPVLAYNLLQLEEELELVLPSWKGGTPWARGWHDKDLRTVNASVLLHAIFAALLAGEDFVDAFAVEADDGGLVVCNNGTDVALALLDLLLGQVGHATRGATHHVCKPDAVVDAVDIVLVREADACRQEA